MNRSSNATAVTSKAAAPAESPRAGGSRAAGAAKRLDVSKVGWTSFAEIEPQALGVTYWFDAPEAGEPGPMTIRFTGKRVGAKAKPGARDRFDVVETVDPVIPGSGPIAVTTRVRGIAPGKWQVTAAPAQPAPRRSSKFGAAVPPRRGSASAVGDTAFAPVLAVLAPGARLGAWSALVAVGALAALVAQWVLASRTGLPPSRVLTVSLVACLVGVAGAKLYYVVGHLIKGDLGRGLDLLTGGMCIQGFVIGVVVVFLAGAGFAGVGVGPLLDVTAPGMMFGMTIGRLGCFFGGCCAGRPTASRWGLWSSDRRLGMRRIPTQLLEAAVALAIGLVTLGLVWAGPPRPAGVAFAGALAAYTLARQLLFPLRAGARHTTYGRILTLALTALALVAVIVLAAVS